MSCKRLTRSQRLAATFVAVGLVTAGSVTAFGDGFQHDAMTTAAQTAQDGWNSNVDSAREATAVLAADSASNRRARDVAQLAKPFEFPPWPITLGALAVLLLGLASGWRLGRHHRR